jgi:NitT/TauT family transport system ATP-binding protein
LNLLAGIVPLIGSGSIKINERDPEIGSRDVAYMLARDSLFPWRTALGNAEFGMEARGETKEFYRAKALNMLAEVGLKDFSNSYPKELSHGMRQRVALARTFALDAQLLLMDEPFGALDAQTKLQLEDLLLRLCHQFKHTVVFVTHDLAEAVALSDRVIVMSSRPGKIIADIKIDLPRPRSIRELQKSEKFHELYSVLWTYLEEGWVRHEG